MTDERRDPRGERDLAPEDAAFVRRLAELYAPPPPTPQQRVAFRAALDRRLARDRHRPWLPALGGLAAAAVALVLALGGPTSRPAPHPPIGDTSPLEALFALAHFEMDSVDEDEEPLPDDYEAIASLFLGEV